MNRLRRVVKVNNVQRKLSDHSVSTHVRKVSSLLVTVACSRHIYVLALNGGVCNQSLIAIGQQQRSCLQTENK